MDVIAILPPTRRSVRDKLQLFLRLWVARHKYEALAPFGRTGGQRLRFHLARLEECWRKVLDYQQALGLEVFHFGPREQFELIHVINAYIERELRRGGRASRETREKWTAYQSALKQLSYEINPFEFAERCSRCEALVRECSAPAQKSDTTILTAREAGDLNRAEPSLC